MKFGRIDYDERIVDLQKRIPEDEPVFLLRGSDTLAPALLLEWSKQLRLSGGDPKMARVAEDHAQEMIRWQSTRGKKLPDLHQDTPDLEPVRLRLTEVISELQVATTNINSVYSELEKLMTAYYGEGSHIYILNDADLKESSKVGAELEDLYIDVNRFNNSKLVLYIDSRKKCKIFKDNVSNKLPNGISSKSHL